MEKTNNFKRKIIISAFSILICILVIGVSVYAALSQTASLTNYITITTGGQTKVGVVVSEYINTASTAVSASPSDSISSWTQKLSKDSNTDSATQALTPADFNYTTGKNYYAWKIDFTNTDASAAYAHITATAVNNSQIDIYVGTTWGTLTKQTTSTAVAGEVTLAKSATATYYIVVATNTALDSLTAVEGQLPFNIGITIDQTAPSST